MNNFVFLISTAWIIKIIVRRCSFFLTLNEDLILQLHRTNRGNYRNVTRAPQISATLTVTFLTHAICFRAHRYFNCIMYQAKAAGFLVKYNNGKRNRHGHFANAESSYYECRGYFSTSDSSRILSSSSSSSFCRRSISCCSCCDSCRAIR